jgi:hypothetical protein
VPGTIVIRIAESLGTLFQLALTCVACFLGLTSAASCRPTNGTLPAHVSNAPFVFADLDGDRKPDLALVELSGQRSEMSNYFVRVKLSAGAESGVGVKGPFGGLRVSARDVNGGDNLDLIVTSNLDAGFIKVLLNDGHGNFTMAEPGDFQWLEKDSGVVLHGPAGPQGDRGTLAPARSSHEDIAVMGRDVVRVFSADSFPRFDVPPAVRRPGLSPLGRSPPAEVALP